MSFHVFQSGVTGKHCPVEAVVPPGLGAPPNHHAGDTEAFHVLDGEVEFAIEGEAMRVGAGGTSPCPTARCTPTPRAGSARPGS